MSVAGQKKNIAALSVASNCTLLFLKLFVGIAIGSVSVLSEAIHSGVDLLAACIAFFAVQTAHKPADAEHPFGHGKIEDISGSIEALLILGAAAWIILESVQKLLHPEPLKVAWLGVAVMLFSAVINYFVSRKLEEVGKKTDSMALKADALHLRTDVMTSAGVMTALFVIELGNLLSWGLQLQWIDPVAAIIVALLIVRAAWKLTMTAGWDLMDSRLPEEDEKWIRNYLVERRSSLIKGFHQLRTRKSGATRFIEFHLIVDRNLSVDESHGLTESIEKAIEEHFPGSSVTIHVEPCDGSCPSDCRAGCLLTPQERLDAQSAVRSHSGKQRSYPAPPE